MIVKVFNNHKSIEVGKHRVAKIEFIKHESGNIDIYRTTDVNGRTISWEGFFVGEYQIIKRLEAEQLDMFNLMEAR